MCKYVLSEIPLIYFFLTCELMRKNFLDKINESRKYKNKEKKRKKKIKKELFLIETLFFSFLHFIRNALSKYTTKETHY